MDLEIEPCPEIRIEGLSQLLLMEGNEEKGKSASQIGK